MADNILLNLGSGGDTHRAIEKGAAKSDVVILDLGGSGAESLVSGGRVPTKLLSGTATRTQVADTITEAVLLASNANRLGASFYNDSTDTLLLGHGTTVVTSTNYTVKIFPNGYHEVEFGFTGEIRGVWVTDPGTGGAKITEYTA